MDMGQQCGLQSVSLLLEEQSDKGLTIYHLVCNFGWIALQLSAVRTISLNFRVFTTMICSSENLELLQPLNSSCSLMDDFNHEQQLRFFLSQKLENHLNDSTFRMFPCANWHQLSVKEIISFIFQFQFCHLILIRGKVMTN